MKYPWEPCFVTARTESYTYETRWGSAVKPSEVHALLKLQNPFHSLLVKLPGVWAGPMSPPARVSSCCFPAHPVHGAVAQAGFAAAGLAWLKVSAAPVLSLAMPHHSCADTFSLWLGCLCSRGLPWFEARGSHKYQAPQGKERAWLGAGQCSCLQEWSAVSAGPGKGVRTPVSASPLNKDPAAGNWTEMHWWEKYEGWWERYLPYRRAVVRKQAGVVFKVGTVL